MDALTIERNAKQWVRAQVRSGTSLREIARQAGIGRAWLSLWMRGGVENPGIKYVHAVDRLARSSK